MSVGRNPWIDTSVVFDESCAWLIEIGDDVVVAPQAYFLAHDASTKRALGYTRIGRTRIGHRVFIGARAVIMPGVSVGDDAIVGAGCVVTRDVPPGTIVVGNPAQEVGLTADYLHRQAEELKRLPRFSKTTQTVAGEITDASKRQMIDDLGTGRGFLE
jgi:maltose O-acetyltransferase